jgi:hypothetical protein
MRAEFPKVIAWIRRHMPPEDLWNRIPD